MKNSFSNMGNMGNMGMKRSGGNAMARFSPKEKPANPKGTFRKLFRFYMRQGKALLTVSVLLLLSALAGVLIPFLIGKSVNAMATGQGQGAALGQGLGAAGFEFYGAVILLIYLTVWILNITQGLIMNKASQNIVKTLRRSMFDKMQKLPLQYHDTHTHGELMSRLTNDIDNISGTIAQSTTELISAVVTIVGSLVMMLILSPVLTAVSMLTVPLVVLLTRLIAGRSRRMFAGQQRELGSLNGLIEESVSGRRAVLAFHMREHVIEAFSQNNRRMKYYAIRAQIWSGMLMPFMNVITNLGYVGVMFAGGMMAVKNPLLIGTVASFGTYSRQFTFPLNNIAGMFNNLQSALAGAERVFEVLEETDEEPDVPDAIDIGTPKGEVEFRNVSFSYVEGVRVLNDVSFAVKHGQKVAIVGETGSGKTTIVNLLTRFYDAKGGSVMIDGLDIKSYKRDSLRNAFSVVLQDTCLFTGTIADNIGYAVPDATPSEIRQAAVLANADSFIQRLKNGYDTEVSGETDALSQGQRQLIAISRAVLCHAPILVLDEATSSVDTRTELKIQAALSRLTKGRTTFVIAHRLSTIRDADVILVLKDGEIAERGNHKELMGRGSVGIYKEMFERQL